MAYLAGWFQISRMTRKVNVIPGREPCDRTPVCTGTPENLDIPGLVLTHHPGMTMLNTA